MKKKQVPAAVKTFFLLFALVATLSFKTSEAGLTEDQFRTNIASIINGSGISQKDLAKTMYEAETRKSGAQTASGYIEHYMNTHFKAVRFSTNRVSIARPGQPDLAQSTACNVTALQTHTGNAIGYYYAFATKCDGTYKYDGKNYTGGSTVYVRAEAGASLLEAFILF